MLIIINTPRFTCHRPCRVGAFCKHTPSVSITLSEEGPSEGGVGSHTGWAWRARSRYDTFKTSWVSPPSGGSRPHSPLHRLLLPHVLGPCLLAGRKREGPRRPPLRIFVQANPTRGVCFLVDSPPGSCLNVLLLGAWPPTVGHMHTHTHTHNTPHAPPSTLRFSDSPAHLLPSSHGPGDQDFRATGLEALRVLNPGTFPPVNYVTNF